jgi:hypothetical protein
MKAGRVGGKLEITNCKLQDEGKLRPPLKLWGIPVLLRTSLRGEEEEKQEEEEQEQE